MTGDSSAGLYPRYCLHLSPTFNTWCLLHASDIHALRSVPDFEVQDFYFHKNLPIKWVRIVGIVVAVDDFPGRRIYTVDDSSGACIECVVTLKAAPASHNAATSISDPGRLLVGNRPQPQPPADCIGVDVGSVVDIKGGLTSFREEMQLKIEKVKVVKSTEQEVALWERRTQFRNDVLLKPWVLSEKQIRRCKKEEMREKGDADEDEKKRRREKEKKRKERKKQERHRQEEKHREEEKKREEEEQCKAKAAADAEIYQYRAYKLRASRLPDSGARAGSGALLRHVLDESIRGKYSALGL